ncbi:virulence-associated V antigen [Endozoicomonas sp. Mp262]|uniref:virulence-associated V antigen n=1 Tax=Endozoicomonas sp. Mp262 TaxID=2919499 RepID=UPI0021D82FEC
MINAIHSNAPVIPQEYSASGHDATNMAALMLEADGPLRALERRGYGLNLDQVGFPEKLAESLQKALDNYKTELGVEGELSEIDESRFIEQFVGKAEMLLKATPEVARDPVKWMSQLDELTASKPKNFHYAAYAPNTRAVGDIAGKELADKQVILNNLWKCYEKINQAVRDAHEKGHDKTPDSRYPISDMAGDFPVGEGGQVKRDSSGEVELRYQHMVNFLKDFFPGFERFYPGRYDEQSFNELVSIQKKVLGTLVDKTAELTGWRDSISATGGRNVLEIYQQRLNVLTKKRETQYNEVKKLADEQALLNSARAKVIEKLKSTDSTKNSTSLGVPDFTQDEKNLMNTLGVSYAGASTKGALDILSEKLSNEVKKKGDSSQLKTTDLQDTNSKYNSTVEAINKFLQQMYEASKAQLY